MSAASIAAALGGKSIGRGQWMAKCPAHSERTGSLSIKEGYAGVIVYCFGGCTQIEVIAALQDRGLWPQREERKREPRRPSRPTPPPADASPDLDRVRRIGYVRHIWREAKDLRGTLAETYLRSRGLTLPDELSGRVLRFHNACPWEKNTVPALLAAFHPINEPDDDARPVALLRRGLTTDGRKLGKPKALGPVKGAVIKLDPDESVEQGLGISQGLEDALDVRQRGWRPIWCVSGDGAISAFPPIPPLSLTIFPDADASGLRAAQACARRWKAAGREVTIIPPLGVKDWNEAPR